MTTEKKIDGKPQLEDGYLKIANELFDALVGIRIPGESRQVFDFILRQTYGYKKSEVAIKLTEFAQATGIKRQNVNRALQKLLKMRLIKVSRNPKRFLNVCKYSINKYYREWCIGIQSDSESKAIPSVIQSDSTTVIQSDSLVPKDKVLKDNLKITTLSVDTQNRLKKYLADLEKEAKLAPLQTVFDHWNNQAIIVHKKLTEKIKQKIRTHLKDNTLQDITKAIDNYSTVLKSSDYFFKFKWPLIDFLDRGLRKFLNEAQPFINFLTSEARERQQAKATRTPSPRPEFPKQLTCKFCNTTSTITHRNIQCPNCSELFYKLTPSGSYKIRFPDKADLITCHKCQYTWSYKALQTFKCPNCGTNNRKNGLTEQDIQESVTNDNNRVTPGSDSLVAGVSECHESKNRVTGADLPYSEQLAADCRRTQEDIKTLSDGLLKDVPALTKSQKEALDE